VHSFTSKAGSRHENEKYYAAAKYNAGFVIAAGICLLFLHHNGAERAIVVQILLFNNA